VCLNFLAETSVVEWLWMQLGDRLIEGEIKEKKAAQRTYQKARESGQRASQLKQHRANIFSVSLSNIAPGEEIRVVIEFQQLAHFAEGRFELHLPLLIALRYNPGKTLTDTPQWGRPTSAALRLVIVDLKSDERFNLIGFNNRPRMLFSFAQPTVDSKLDQPRRFIDYMQAQGVPGLLLVACYSCDALIPGGELGYLVWAEAESRERFGLESCLNQKSTLILNEADPHFPPSRLSASGLSG
jgi:hypothetical protein